MRCFCERSLAEIVLYDTRAASVLERYGLDYFCKGRRTLRTACMGSFPVERVSSELRELVLRDIKQETPLSFENLSLSALMDYILHTHHAYLKKELPVLHKLLKALSKFPNDAGSLHSRLMEKYFLLETELARHINVEEGILFYRIRRMEALQNEPDFHRANVYTFQAPLALLEEQHEFISGLVDEIISICSKLVREDPACLKFLESFNQLARDLHLHIHLENNILFPRAMAIYKGLEEQELE